VSAGIDVSEVRTGRKPGTRVMTVRSGTCGIPTLLVERTASRCEEANEAIHKLSSRLWRVSRSLSLEGFTPTGWLPMTADGT
jgi:hypothetical protein